MDGADPFADLVVVLMGVCVHQSLRVHDVGALNDKRLQGGQRLGVGQLRGGDNGLGIDHRRVVILTRDTMGRLATAVVGICKGCNGLERQASDNKPGGKLTVPMPCNLSPHKTRIAHDSPFEWGGHRVGSDCLLGVRLRHSLAGGLGFAIPVRFHSPNHTDQAIYFDDLGGACNDLEDAAGSIPA